MSDMRVAMPGKVESFDIDTGLATIQPMIQRRYAGDQQPTSLPVIQRVPLVVMRTQKAFLSLPITKGDPVLLVFSDRAIDNWLGGNGAQPSDPMDIRQHDLSDAFAILGGWPELMVPLHPGASGDNAELLVAPGVKIGFGNGEVELLALLDSLIEQIDFFIDDVSAHKHIGFAAILTAPPDAVTLSNLIAVKTDVLAIKTQLGLIKI